MPRTRVRCTRTSMPLLGSVSERTRAACGLVLEITPTTPSRRDHRHAGLDAVDLALVEGQALEPARSRHGP